jgi:hypothetical protein
MHDDGLAARQLAEAEAASNADLSGKELAVRQLAAAEAASSGGGIPASDQDSDDDRSDDEEEPTVQPLSFETPAQWEDGAASPSSSFRASSMGLFGISEDSPMLGDPDAE